MFKSKYLLFTTLICACLSLATASAQDKDGRKYKELFPVGKMMNPNAYHIGFGITRMFGPAGGNHSFDWQRTNSSYVSQHTTKGGFGLFLEGGYNRFYEANPLMDELSISAAVIQRGGRQTHEAQLVRTRSDGNHDTTFYSGNGYFDQTAASLAITGTQHIQINSKKYWSVSYGIDANYRIFNTTNYLDPSPFEEYRLPPKMLVNGHIKIGYGFYWKKDIVLNPTISVPVISTYGVGPVRYFNNDFLPVLVSLRFIWINKKSSMACPTIKPTRGEKVKKKYYLQELFHPDSRSKREIAEGRD